MAYVVPPLGLIFVDINKNASTAIKAAIRERWLREYIKIQAPADLVGRPEKVVAMWREPHERIASAYRWFEKRMPFSSFVMDVIDRDLGRDDKHYMRQVDFVSVGENWLADVIVPWDFDEIRQLFDLPEIPVLHRTRPQEFDWTDEARSAFDDKYRLDLEVWSASLAGG